MYCGIKLWTAREVREPVLSSEAGTYVVLVRPLRHPT